MRLKRTIEYAGTRYSGWQIQKNARTVQGEVEQALREGAGVHRFELYGSGRTDAGVHALGQVAHLDLDTALPIETLRRRVNEALPSDINILRIDRVRHRFHARHSAVARSYVYQIARRRSAFGKAFVWWVKDDLDVPAMQHAAKHFIGMHDFQSFSDDDPEEKSTQVLLDRCELVERGDAVLVYIDGSHFLWKMVRRIVGVLVEVGRGAMSEDQAAGLLRAPSRAPARLTAPASGLFLARVYYEGDRRGDSVEPPLRIERV